MHIGSLPEIMAINEGLLDTFKSLKKTFSNRNIAPKAKEEAESCAYSDFMYMVKINSFKNPDAVCSLLIEKIKKYKTDLNPEGLKIYINVFKQTYTKELKDLLRFYHAMGNEMLRDPGFYLAFGKDHIPSWYNKSLK